MRRTFDVILFDLGSTLIYFDADFAQVLAAGYADCYTTLDGAGIKLEREAFLARFQAQMEAYRREREMEFIEYTTQYILTLTLAEFDHPKVPETLLRLAVDAIYRVTQKYWETEHDTQTTLQELQKDGYRLGLISNAGDGPDVQALVDQAGLRLYFDVILVSADLGIRKPNPRIFHHALEYWGVPPQRAAMVGDTLGADILGAHNAGLFSIWITRRADTPDNHEYAETIQPDARIATLQELPTLLRRLQQ